MSDELKVESMFMKMLLGKILKKYLRDSLNLNADFSIKGFNITVNEKDALITFNADIKMPKENLLRLIENNTP